MIPTHNYLNTNIYRLLATPQASIILNVRIKKNRCAQLDGFDTLAVNQYYILKDK